MSTAAEAPSAVATVMTPPQAADGRRREAAIRLGWLDAPRASRALLGSLAVLASDVREQGLDHIVLCGMGGSSLAPEVITRTAGVELVVLDSTDPSVVKRALDGDLSKTVIVVSSKSGGTVETGDMGRAHSARPPRVGAAEGLLPAPRARRRGG